MNSNDSAGLFALASVAVSGFTLLSDRLGVLRILSSATTREAKDWVELLAAVGGAVGTWALAVIAIRKMSAKKGGP